MYQGHAVAVIIPALNEEQSLPQVLGAIPSWADDVVVVDNGSTDQTADVAKRHGARVVSQAARGYGAACLAGIAAVPDADVVVFMDADFSDHPEQMEVLVAPLARGEADLVIGSRTRGRRERGALTLQQRWGNVAACWLIRWLWGYRYTDLGPFRAVRSDALHGLEMDDRSYGWTIQMQIRAVRAGLRVREVPVDYRRRIGRSKISGTVRGVIGAGVKILSTVFRECVHGPPVSAWIIRPEHLIVFTRFPEPGIAKTRLIPALGAEAAAGLQRSMTLQTLLTTERLRTARDLSSEVRFTGGDRARMASQFGRQHTYLPQRGRDLGIRMQRALAEAFARGSQRAVVIGTDCPALDCSVLNAAFDALRTHDCVVGPAVDGGYYLIGLRRPCRELFERVSWGSPLVLEQTLRRAAAAALTVHQLPALPDVDAPQDLPLWRTHRRPRISVIIPALHEAECVARSVQSAACSQDVEVLVVDGGSHDATPQIARAAGATVIVASAGRARQMNAGAAAARGSILLFLHADTLLPRGFAQEVQRLLEQPHTALAAFRLGIDHPRRAFRWIERFANLRSRWMRLPYGDQALAMLASTFYQLGGFRDLPIMEDFDLVRRARRLGCVRIADAAVRTSPRRWLGSGVLRLTIVHQACLVGYLLGVRTERLVAWRGGDTDKPRPATPNRLTGRNSSRPREDVLTLLPAEKIGRDACRADGR